MQALYTPERMEVNKAVIAVRLPGLWQGGVCYETQSDSCEKLLTPTEWKPRWVKLEDTASGAGPDREMGLYGTYDTGPLACQQTNIFSCGIS